MRGHLLSLEPSEQALIRLFEKALEGVLIFSIQPAVVLFQKAQKKQYRVRAARAGTANVTAVRLRFRGS